MSVFVLDVKFLYFYFLGIFAFVNHKHRLIKGYFTNKDNEKKEGINSTRMRTNFACGPRGWFITQVIIRMNNKQFHIFLLTLALYCISQATCVWLCVVHHSKQSTFHMWFTKTTYWLTALSVKFLPINSKRSLLTAED